MTFTNTPEQEVFEVLNNRVLCGVTEPVQLDDNGNFPWQNWPDLQEAVREKIYGPPEGWL